MGCNCKNKIDKIIEYSEDTIEQNDNFLIIFINFVLRSIFGLFAGFLVIIALIPFLIYIIVCLLIGVEPKVRIFNLKKRLLQGK